METDMETILFLAFTEADGSLAKPALEALGAAVDLGCAADRWTDRRGCGSPPPARSPDAARIAFWA